MEAGWTASHRATNDHFADDMLLPSKKHMPASLIIFFCAVLLNLPAQTSSNATSARQFDEILDALVITNALTTNAVMPDGWLKKRSQAVVQLQALGTNALPLLVEELNHVADVEKTNAAQAIGLKVRIWAAFIVLGPQAKSLIPKLVVNLNTDRDPGNAAQALANIGGAVAGFALVDALTNYSVNVQVSAASSLAFFKNDRDVADAAVPSLLRCLGTGSTTLRSVAMNTLSTLKARPRLVVPALMRTAENDPDFILRAYAVQSIGRFGTNAIFVKDDLEKLSRLDKNETVRRTAKRILVSMETNAPVP